MDALPFSCMTPEVGRLVSFHKRPLQTDRKLGISNSPAKFARYGFCRLPNAKSDEVTCKDCHLTYGNWEGESPGVVHLVLSEDCEFFSPPSPADALQSHPRVQDARRLLFSSSPAAADDSGYQSQLEESPRIPQSPYSVLNACTNLSFPYKPKLGSGYNMLFASRRLNTFKDTNCNLCKKWAEEGFMYQSTTNDVQCVFCEVVFPFDSFEACKLHAEASPRCPRVLLIDVGNVSREDEDRIRFKHLQWLSRNTVTEQSFAIVSPQYEEYELRVGTYENWPYSSWDDQLQPSVMSEAGFYFTGCADKVKCFSCGLGLRKWRQGSNPWEQHAKFMPTCPFLQSKGDDFIQQAALAEALTEADLPSNGNDKEESNNSGHLTATAPGSLTMDPDALTAALTTSQYSESVVRQAVLTYFFRTSKFPTQEILIGQLRANDINFPALCKQRDLNHKKDVIIQQKDSVIQETQAELQETQTELQQKDTVIQQTQAELQQRDGALQNKDQVIQSKDQVIESQHQEIQQHREQLQHHSEELKQNKTELLRKARVMYLQEKQIEALQLQLNSLQAWRLSAGGDSNAPPPPPPQPLALAQPPPPPPPPLPQAHSTVCKVCLSAEIQTLFKPCRHVTCCAVCAGRLACEVCPVCRVPIEKVLPAYIS